MYRDGSLFRRSKWARPATRSAPAQPSLLLAGGEALPRLHPLHQGGLAVANGPADPDVGWPVAAHPRLGQPGQADLEELGGLFGRQQRDGRRRRLFGLRAAGMRDCDVITVGPSLAVINQPQPESGTRLGCSIGTPCSTSALQASIVWSLGDGRHLHRAHMPRNRSQFAQQFFWKIKIFYAPVITELFYACFYSWQFVVRRSRSDRRMRLEPHDNNVGNCSARTHRVQFRRQSPGAEKNYRQGRRSVLVIARLPRCARRTPA